MTGKQEKQGSEQAPSLESLFERVIFRGCYRRSGPPNFSNFSCIDFRSSPACHHSAFTSVCALRAV